MDNTYVVNLRALVAASKSVSTDKARVALCHVGLYRLHDDMLGYAATNSYSLALVCEGENAPEVVKNSFNKATFIDMIPVELIQQAAKADARMQFTWTVTFDGPNGNVTLSCGSTSFSQRTACVEFPNLQHLTGLSPVPMNGPVAYTLQYFDVSMSVFKALFDKPSMSKDGVFIVHGNADSSPLKVGFMSCSNDSFTALVLLMPCRVPEERLTWGVPATVPV